MWIQSQLSIGVSCLLAPSRFARDRSDKNIRALLEVGQEFIDVANEVAPYLPALVPIVVRFDELGDRRWVQPVNESRLPIAPVFAGYADPMSTFDQLEGAIELLRSAELAVLLRCDLSLAGFMALDAAFGALARARPSAIFDFPPRPRTPLPHTSSCPSLPAG